MPGVPGQPTFDGELAADGEAIAGTFRQSGQSLPFALRRTTAAAASAPAPSPPAQPVPGEGAVGEWLGVGFRGRGRSFLPDLLVAAR